MAMIRSSAVNLALGYVLFGAIALVILAAPMWYGWQVTIREGRIEILQEDAQRQAEVFRRGGLDGLRHFIEERVGLQIAGERILLLADAQHHVLAGNLPAWPDGVPQASGTYTVPVNLDGRPVQTVLVRVDLPGGYSLLVGRDLGRYAPVETNFWLALGAALLLLTLVGGFGALLIRRELMSRIQSLRQTVSAIMQGELSHRLHLHNSGDELDTLSQTINRMLDQIELLVHGIRNVSNSIAHDLRTPLAELRARLEVLAVTRPAAAETFLEIEGAVADVDRVIGIFNALLRLAEIDSGLRRSGFVTVDLAEVAAQAAEFYAPAAELKGVPLSFQGQEQLRVAGDPLLLAQAVSNLIDNALKYSSAGGRITVETHRREDGAVELTVRDNGPGIPDADKPRAIERFFRGDNSRGTPGVGLGLSLVDAVARLHGGVLELRDNHPGLRAAFVLSGAKDLVPYTS